MTDRLWCFKDLRGETWNENNCMIWWVEKQERLCNKQKSCVIRTESKTSKLSPAVDYNNKEKILTYQSQVSERYIKPLLEAAEIISVSYKTQYKQLRGIWVIQCNTEERVEHCQNCTAETRTSGHWHPLQIIVRQSPLKFFSKVMQLAHLPISLAPRHNRSQKRLLLRASPIPASEGL